jgi:hypothetical protein
MREINNGGGFNTVPLIAHFGLGDATNVDTVRLEWPSGTLQELHDVSPKLVLTVYEPPRLLAALTNGMPQFSLRGGRGLAYRIEASPDLANWSPVGTLTISNASGTAQMIDTSPSSLGWRFYRAS